MPIPDPARGPFTTRESDFPFVTVIIPVRNEAGYIGRCLQALAAQDYPRDRLEVIVLDGGSTDSTEDEVRVTADAAGLTVFYADNPKRTAATGFNLGLTLAHGAVIVRLDGHCRPANDFISASVRALETTGADAVGGPIETRGHGDVGRAIALAMSSSFGIGDTAFRHAGAGPQETDSVPYGAYRREAFERAGNLAEDIDRGEDDEFNYRLRAAGGRIVLVPEIRSTYYCRETLTALARQYWGYGLAKAAVLQRHPERLRARHLVPSALVAVLAGGIVFGGVSRWFARVGWLAAGAYAAANTVATLRLARDHRGEACYLPLAFVSIHLPAGAGMLVGSVRGFLRGRRRNA
jgi:cellulose synthase/poly-beta-1,6-N-acetylglucosamine synthase-like glycosyltransferase